MYQIRNGRRILLSQREQRIRQLEEIGYARATAYRKAFYVIEDQLTKSVNLTCDPTHNDIIVRVCPFIPKRVVINRKTASQS